MHGFACHGSVAAMHLPGMQMTRFHAPLRVLSYKAALNREQLHVSVWLKCEVTPSHPNAPEPTSRISHTTPGRRGGNREGRLRGRRSVQSWPSRCTLRYQLPSPATFGHPDALPVLVWCGCGPGGVPVGHPAQPSPALQPSLPHLGMNAASFPCPPLRRSSTPHPRTSPSPGKRTGCRGQRQTYCCTTAP